MGVLTKYPGRPRPVADRLKFFRLMCYPVGYRTWSSGIPFQDTLAINDYCFTVGSDFVDGNTFASEAVFSFAGQVETGTMNGTIEFGFVEDNGLARFMATGLRYGGIHARAYLRHHNATLGYVTTNGFQGCIGRGIQIEGEQGGF